MTPRERPWRAVVGPPEKFDIMAAHQFTVMTQRAGLREEHYLGDIGCGCLRGGRLFIAYLAEGHYFGLEPDETSLTNGILYEASPGLVNFKAARFSERSDFRLDTEWSHIEFDRILAQSVLTHLDLDGARHLFDAFAATLTKPKSQAWFTFMRGNDERVNNPDRIAGEGTGWAYYISMTHFRPQTVRAELLKRGLKMRIFTGVRHPNGHTWAAAIR
jgi:hypothetical protein